VKCQSRRQAIESYKDDLLEGHFGILFLLVLPVISLVFQAESQSRNLRRKEAGVMSDGLTGGSTTEARTPHKPLEIIEHPR